MLNAKSVDPDQMPRTAASDLGMHCLQAFVLRDARHKWVRGTKYAWTIFRHFLKESQLL